MEGLISILGTLNLPFSTNMCCTFCSSYFPKYLLKVSQVYAKPLANPADSIAKRFNSFVEQILKIVEERFVVTHKLYH